MGRSWHRLRSALWKGLCTLRWLVAVVKLELLDEISICSMGYLFALQVVRNILVSDEITVCVLEQKFLKDFRARCLLFFDWRCFLQIHCLQTNSLDVRILVTTSLVQLIPQLGCVLTVGLFATFSL
jgi:hypothetical protein